MLELAEWLGEDHVAFGTDLNGLGRFGMLQNYADLRLVIEEGPRRGSFIYKTVDRTTGETIKQYPREQLVKLSEDPNYVAGAVANTRA